MVLCQMEPTAEKRPTIAGAEFVQSCAMVSKRRDGRGVAAHAEFL